MTLAFLLQAVNMLAFSYYNSPEWVVFGSAFTGLCYGTIFTLMPAATADFYGIRNLGVNYGLVFTAFGVAGVVGPLLGAQINDHFGSYLHAYQISAGMLVLGALLAMLTKPPGTPVELGRHRAGNLTGEGPAGWLSVTLLRRSGRRGRR